MTGEFPRIDDRKAGLVNTHGWYACARPDQDFVGRLAGVTHVNAKTSKRLAQYLLPEGDTISEPVFVERARMRPKATAGCSPWSGADARTAATSPCSTPLDVASGPVALVQLGHRVPDGFHGNWVGAS